MIHHCFLKFPSWFFGSIIVLSFSQTYLFALSFRTSPPLDDVLLLLCPTCSREQSAKISSPPQRIFSGAPSYPGGSFFLHPLRDLPLLILSSFPTGLSKNCSPSECFFSDRSCSRVPSSCQSIHFFLSRCIVTTGLGRNCLSCGPQTRRDSPRASLVYFSLFLPFCSIDVIYRGLQQYFEPCLL